PVPAIRIVRFDRVLRLDICGPRRDLAGVHRDPAAHDTHRPDGREQQLPERPRPKGREWAQDPEPQTFATSIDRHADIAVFPAQFRPVRFLHIAADVLPDAGYADFFTKMAVRQSESVHHGLAILA